MVRVRYIFVLFFLLLFIGVMPFSAYPSKVVQIGAYDTLSVALLDNGTVWAWGDKTGPMSSSVPVMLNVSNVTAMSIGNFLLFLKSDGTVWACGHNEAGELGDCSQMNSYDRIVRVGNLSDVNMIAASGGNGMALKSDGTLWMWGYNRNGELGTGTPGFLGGANYSLLPVQVPITDITSIASADANFFVLKSDGTLWGWGRDYDGSLGVNMNDSRVIVWTDVNNNTQAFVINPIQIPLSNITTISSNSQNTLAIINGTLWAWGENYCGQLGIGNHTTVDRPVMVKGLTDVTSVIASTSYSLALKSDGTVWAWGFSMGGLGVPASGDLATTNTPVMVAGLNNVAQLAGGWTHILALKSDGTVWAWGDNNYYELGNGGVGSGSSTPIQVLIGSQTASSPTIPATITATPNASPPNMPVNGQNNSLNTFSIIGLISLILLAGAFAYVFLLRKK